MMIHEFTQRTCYEPTIEEYRFIEESYYEFDGNKDAFCKAWLKDKNDGHWDKELKLRKALADCEAKHAKQIEEMEGNLNFYRPYFERSRQFAKQLEEANAKLERIEKSFRRFFDNQND